MLKEILILGIGGDGVQLIGNFLMNASLNRNYKISFYPIYGSQMRGGESTLVIKLSDEEIVNPVIYRPDIVAIMNDTYKNKYIDSLKTSDVIDMTKSNVIKNKNIILLAKLVKKLGFIDAKDIYYEIDKKFKREEVRKSVKYSFDMELQNES